MRVHDLFLKTWDLMSFLQHGSMIAQDPVVRLILTSDGTITRTLQALHQQPIRLEVKAQADTPLEPEMIEYLEVSHPWKAISRKVWLKKDHHPLLYASTILAFTRENSGLFEEIHQRSKPLGFLLEEFQLPSLKDKLLIGRMIHPDTSRSLGLAPATELWARHYRLTIQNRSPRASLWDLPSEQGEREGEAPSGRVPTEGGCSGGVDLPARQAGASPYHSTRASVLEIFSPTAFRVE